MSELQGLNEKERSKLLEAITDPRDLAIIVLGMRHGFRSSEIADLKLSDICLDTNWIRIRRGKGSKTNDHVIEDGPEALNERTVLLNALVARNENPSEYVFISQKGSNKLSRSQIFRIFQSAAKKAGLSPQKRHFHCCKHTAAFSMLESGASVAEVQKYFGWKSLASVGRYLEVSNETACQAARKMYARKAA